MKTIQFLLSLSATFLFNSCVTLDDDERVRDDRPHRTTTVTEETTYSQPQSSSVQTQTIRSN